MLRVTDAVFIIIDSSSSLPDTASINDSQKQVMPIAKQNAEIDYEL